jgi:hypothetical protein
MAAPDYSELLANDKLSDLTIVIAEEVEHTSDEQLDIATETQGPSKRAKVSAGHEDQQATAAAAEQEESAGAAAAAGPAADVTAAMPEVGTAAAAPAAAEQAEAADAAFAAGPAADGAAAMVEAGTAAFAADVQPGAGVDGMGGSSSSRSKVIPGLYGCSSFCKTKLDSWSDCRSDGKLQMRILAPKGALH